MVSFSVGQRIARPAEFSVSFLLEATSHESGNEEVTNRELGNQERVLGKHEQLPGAFWGSGAQESGSKLPHSERFALPAPLGYCVLPAALLRNVQGDGQFSDMVEVRAAEGQVNAPA